MLLASLALVGVLISGGALWLTFRELHHAEEAMLAARAAELRYRAWSAESRRFLASRTAIADATSGTADAVRLGSSVTQAGHQAIAEIPFGILDAIPGTREGSKRVREVHDGISGAVYGGIAAATGGFGRLSRRRLTGEGVTPQVEGGSDPLEPPTPPALPPE
ncbi:MAG TPA: hypothetical protein VLI04_18085 [Nocardioidaceae bacterium]|nr:hypothetical protein [Nocardioidaceae bacterium]